MQLAARVRLVLARRPWLYWLAVAGLAAGIAFGVERRLAQVDAARERWSPTTAVPVAVHDHRPGDPLVVRLVELPRAAVPDRAVGRVPAGARATQRIAAGEVVVDLDVLPAEGPAAGARPGTLVVPIPDPLAADLAIGQGLQVVAEGIVLAERATAVDVAGEVVFAAVDPADAPLVAAAVERGTATLLLVP